MVIVLLGLAYYVSSTTQQKGLPITQQVILSASDFPNGTAQQYTPVQTANNEIDSLRKDAAISVITTEKDNYTITVTVRVYLFNFSGYSAHQYYIDQTGMTGDNLFGVDNWARVTPDIGEGCTYYYHFYPEYSQGPGSWVPERTNFYVVLYKGNFSAVMSIDYMPVGEPNIYDQAYIEHIMQMQADKLE